MVWEGDYMVHANTTKQSGPIRWVCFPPLKFMGWMGLCPWQGGSKADGREICRETKSPTMYQTWWGWYKLNAAWYLEEMQMNDLLIQLWPKYGFSEPGYHPPSPNDHTHTHTHRQTQFWCLRVIQSESPDHSGSPGHQTHYTILIHILPNNNMQTNWRSIMV